MFLPKYDNRNNVISDLNSVTSKNNEIIEQYRIIFKQLWHFGIDATKKIPRLEIEIDLAYVIHKVAKKGIKQFVEKLISKSRYEVLFCASILREQ